MKKDKANTSVAFALVNTMFTFVRGEDPTLPVALWQGPWGTRQGRTLSYKECFESKNTKSMLAPDYSALVSLHGSTWY